MATFARLDHYECDIYQSQNFMPINYDDDVSNPSEAIFFIDIFSWRSPGDCKHKNLTVLQEHMLHGNTSWHEISSKLSELNIPYQAHPSMIAKITNHARSAAYGDRNMGSCCIIPLVVTIKPAASLSLIEEEANAEAVTRSINGHVLNLVPASKSSIEALEKIKVKGCSRPCVICLEQMVVRSEAACMPCLHIYHPVCILNWLRNSNLCPLCRFQMS